MKNRPSRRQPSAKGTEREEGARTRLTISLSPKSVDAWKELRAATDADTDSEVFRNALRLYSSLLRAHQDGKVMFIRDTRTGKEEQVNLFFPAA